MGQTTDCVRTHGPSLMQRRLYLILYMAPDGGFEALSDGQLHRHFQIAVTLTISLVTFGSVYLV
jgi:hypothetical protein